MNNNFNFFKKDLLLYNDVNEIPWIHADGLMRLLHKRLVNDPAWRMGGIRVKNIFNKWDVISKEYLLRPPIKVLDFGAGIYHPFSNISQFYIRYNSSGWAVENDPRFLPKRAAECLLNTLFECLPDLSEDQIIRIKNFDLKSLQRGIWSDNVASVNRHIGDVCDFDQGDFDFIFSQSVLEHVDNFYAVIKKLGDITINGGINAHVVDLRDHRSYSDPTFTKWDFLCEEHPGGPFCNRLRASQILRSFEDAGFQVLKCARQIELPPDTLYPRLLKEFSNLDLEDIETTGMRIIAKKV